MARQTPPADRVQMLPTRLRDRITVAPTGCWLWTGATTSDGYGTCEVLGVRDGKRRRRQKAHRAVWEALCGPIATGLVIDHLCRVTLCVNPAHLEPVTQQENMRRSAVNGGALYVRPPRPLTCAHGHAYTPENTRVVKRGVSAGSYECRACGRDRARRRREAACA